MTDPNTQHDAAIQEGERIAAADEYFKARTWIMDTSDNRRIFEAGFDRAYALLSKLRAPVAGSVVPPMPPTKDRGPSDFEGYTESDFDWNRSNPGALTWLADNHAAIRAALSAQPGAQKSGPTSD